MYSNHPSQPPYKSQSLATKVDYCIYKPSHRACVEKNIVEEKKKEKKEVIYWKSDSEYKAISKGEVEKSLVW